jgi:hypothetical protein
MDSMAMSSMTSLITYPSTAPITATATTCVIISLTQDIDTITHTSGETGIYPQTTYTAVSIESITFSAGTLATCLQPGETLPTLTLSIPAEENIVCSTTIFPESTEVQTYAPGVSFDFISTTTRTATEISTSITPAYTYVDCELVPDYQDPATCNTIKPLTWASLVITFVTIQLTWWIFDIPLLWQKKEAETRGFATLFPGLV